MQDRNAAALGAAMQALQQQRDTLGDVVLELALAPLRAQLAALQRPAGLQRRQVTVLFADVVGSTAMASSLHAEDTLDVLNGALQRMADLVQTHGGRVLRFTGDGVKAAFGMGDTREDDAERAVRAGLAIVQAGREQAAAARRTHGIGDFAVRVGVHTGDVAMGAGVEADNTAMGAAVHTAARMEQSAPPGTLRISHDTWSQVRGLFDMEPQPPLLVKGIAAPMQTYLVRAALERSFAGVQRGLQGMTTAMVGRQGELQQLLQTVAAAQGRGQLQAVTLLGDAGLGKSRLLRELVAALPTQPACRLLTVRSQPDGQLRPWGLLRSLLAAQCGVADTDSAEAARAKVEQGLAPWFSQRDAGPGDGQGDERRSEQGMQQGGDRAVRQAQLLGQLSGLDFGNSPHVRGLDPRMLRDQAFAALRAGLQGLASRSALPVLLVEDLHWADDGSLDMLQHLLQHAAELPLALLMTARPTLLARRPQWSAAGTQLQLQLQLQPLAASDSGALAQALLQRLADIPSKLSGLVVGRAEGNPYYMEELVRRLIDDGVIVAGDPHWTVHEDRLDTVRLPGTLVGLLQARLDALPPAERLAARQASVIGHVFWDDALQAVHPVAAQSLPALQQAAFVRAHATSDFDGTSERQFDHHLLHQVTYDTLLNAERRLGHGAVARWLVQRTQGRGAEFMAMTGEHAERAGETALAIDCFQHAGAEAQKRFANTAASAWLRRAVVLLAESQPGRRVDLLDQLGTIADAVGDRTAQHALHQEAVAILERDPDDARQARLWFRMSLLAQRTGDMAAIERWARLALGRAERCGAALWAALARGSVAYLLFSRADHVDARAQLALALQWAALLEAADERAETEAKLLTISAMIDEQQGHVTAARDTLLEVLARGQALGAPRLQLNALHNLANVATELGRWDEKLAWGQRLHTLAHAVGSVLDLAFAEHHTALAREHQGDEKSALNGYQRALAHARAANGRRLEADVLDRLGRLHLARGEASAALPWFVQATAVFALVEEPLNACCAAAAQALCESRLGRTASAAATVDGVLDRLGGELAGQPAAASIEARWNCQQLLHVLGDARAAALLEQLHADIQQRAIELTDAADRGRLIQALPVFRDIVAAYSRHSKASAGR